MHVNNENTKILHYVEKSFQGRPAFILLMEDGKQYISSGCEFLEYTQENRDYLIKEYDVEKEIHGLLKSEGVEWYDLKNASCMLRGCNDLTTVSLDLPNVVRTYWMLRGCTSLTTVSLDLPNVKNADSMLRYCANLTTVSLDLPNPISALWMLEGCDSLEQVSLTIPKYIDITTPQHVKQEKISITRV